MALNEPKQPPFALDAVTAVTTVLAKHLLAGREEILGLRQELEAACTIDFNLDVEDAKSLTNAWSSFSKLQADAERQLSAMQGQVDAAQRTVAQQADTLTKLELELAKAQHDASKADEITKLKRENADQAQENELLLLQLHQVQEELERYFLLCQELKGVPTRQAGKITYPLRGISLDLRERLARRELVPRRSRWSLGRAGFDQYAADPQAGRRPISA